MLALGNIEIEKKIILPVKDSFFTVMQTLKNYQCLKNYFGEKTINTLLVTCMIIIKFSLYKSNKKLLFSLLINKTLLCYEVYKTYFSLLIINKYYTSNSVKPFLNLLIINKYYTTISIKPLFSLSIINKYYTMNSIEHFVAIQLIILNFCRQLLSSLCITNYHINTVIKQHAPK